MFPQEFVRVDFRLRNGLFHGRPELYSPQNAFFDPMLRLVQVRFLYLRRFGQLTNLSSLLIIPLILSMHGENILRNIVVLLLPMCRVKRFLAHIVVHRSYSFTRRSPCLLHHT
jgi:hypothetical protein